MSFMSDADRPRRTVIITGNDVAGAENGIRPQKRECKCTYARGVWIDRWSGARCDVCNLIIADWRSQC